MGIGAGDGFDAQASGHAQMHQQGEPAGEFENGIFSASAQAVDGKAPDLPAEGSGGRFGDRTIPRDAGGNDGVSVEGAGAQVAHDGFDFGQFGHGQKVRRSRAVFHRWKNFPPVDGFHPPVEKPSTGGKGESGKGGGEDLRGLREWEGPLATGRPRARRRAATQREQSAASSSTQGFPG